MEDLKAGSRFRDWSEMRDTGVLIALVLGTVGAGILFYYAWPERHIYPVLRRMLYLIAGCLVFLWVSLGWMWFSV